MSSHFQKMPLNEEDRRLLSKDSRMMLFAVILLGVMGTAAALLFGWDIFQSDNHQLKVAVIAIAGAPLLIGVVFYLRAQLDAMQGQKGVVSGVISKKSASKNPNLSASSNKITRYFFWLDGEGRKYTVEVEEYLKYEEGDRVRLHMGLRSGRVFKVERYF